ncbi:MAG: DUF342 domain-containing protein [Planctomycetes bacterium]|nr:DUF342 domain-containing protein [Planctomycetota bacterium]
MAARMRLSEDGLLAILDLPAGHAVTLPEIVRLLAAAGVRAGIRAETLPLATAPAASDRSLVLAAGRAPAAPRPSRLDPPIAHTDPPRDVRPGLVLGRLLLPSPGEPGQALDGSILPIPRGGPADDGVRIGHGLRVDAQGSVVATAHGTLEHRRDGTLEVVPAPGRRIVARIDFSGYRAYIDLRAGETLPPGAWREVLDRAGISYGILPASQQEVERASDQPRRIMVARGDAPVHGSSALIEHLLEPLRPPEPDLFDAFDLRLELRSRLVQAGTALLYMMPSNPGSPGTDVFGRSIDPPRIRQLDALRLLGPGTRIRDGDEQVIEAARDGLYQRPHGDQVSIATVQRFPGGILPAHGEVRSELTLIVDGGIGDGARVKSGGDIIVLGDIGDARVTAAGDLLVLGDILPGRNRVKAHRSLLARGISGREVRAGSVTVLRRLRSCTVSAADMVSAQDIIGGSIVAAAGVVCESLMDDGTGTTRIEVGRDLAAERLAEHIRAALPQLSRQVAELRQRCEEAARSLPTLPPSEQGRADAALKAGIDAYKRALGDHAAAREALHGHLLRLRRPRHSAAVAATDRAGAGVTIVIGKAAAVTNAPVMHPRFVLRDGRIVV